MLRYRFTNSFSLNLALLLYSFFPQRKSQRNTPATDGNAATNLGTRRSARLRDHKTSAHPSPTEGTQSQPMTSKTHKEKRKSDSLNAVGSSEKSKEASARKESNMKQGKQV